MYFQRYYHSGKKWNVNKFSLNTTFAKWTGEQLQNNNQFQGQPQSAAFIMACDDNTMSDEREKQHASFAFPPTASVDVLA